MILSEIEVNIFAKSGNLDTRDGNLNRIPILLLEFKVILLKQRKVSLMNIPNLNFQILIAHL